MVSHGCAMTSCILIPSSGESSTSFPKDFLTDLPLVLRVEFRDEFRDKGVRIVPQSCTCARTKFLKAYRGRHQRFSDSWYPLASHHPRTIAPGILQMTPNQGQVKMILTISWVCPCHCQRMVLERATWMDHEDPIAHPNAHTMHQLQSRSILTYYERRPCKTLQNRLKSMIGLSNRSGRWWSVGAIGSCNTL
ncbi:hypothetical protein F5880DRAFT_1514904 [Lentinula raphanica]|nr:hypothetical protein F5880DRAFT_1514904 [Lentinula raphanica]